MDRFYIITNSDKDPSLEITGKIVGLFKKKIKEAVKYSRLPDSMREPIIIQIHP